jgi:NO-binding membrane sensor protein with MHYT domain
MSPPGVRTERGGTQLGWLTLHSVVFGLYPIWAMHFIGMRAYRLGIPVTYEIAGTGRWVRVPSAWLRAGLRVAFRWPAPELGGVAMGFGVPSMQYTGMAAMRLRPTSAEMEYSHGALTEQMMAILTVIAVFTASAIAIILAAARQVRDTLEVGSDVA